MIKAYMIVEADASENQLSKGLIRVSRSQKNPVKNSVLVLQEKYFSQGKTSVIGIKSQFPD
jgi:hypothetical protein